KAIALASPIKSRWNPVKGLSRKKSLSPCICSCLGCVIGQSVGLRGFCRFKYEARDGEFKSLFVKLPRFHFSDIVLITDVCVRLSLITMPLLIYAETKIA